MRTYWALVVGVLHARIELLRRDPDAGYTTETVVVTASLVVAAIVVVAIIGIISLVSVPNFISMQRSGKLKASLREFTSDIRRMRQRAVTRHLRTTLSFTAGTATTGRRRRG